MRITRCVEENDPECLVGSGGQDLQLTYFCGSKWGRVCVTKLNPIETICTLLSWSSAAYQQKENIDRERLKRPCCENRLWHLTIQDWMWRPAKQGGVAVGDVQPGEAVCRCWSDGAVWNFRRSYGGNAAQVWLNLTSHCVENQNREVWLGPF